MNLKSKVEDMADINCNLHSQLVVKENQIREISNKCNDLRAKLAAAEAKLRNGPGVQATSNISQPPAGVIGATDPSGSTIFSGLPVQRRQLSVGYEQQMSKLFAKVRVRTVHL